jgi:hypothetical protein
MSTVLSAKLRYSRYEELYTLLKDSLSQVTDDS